MRAALSTNWARRAPARCQTSHSGAHDGAVPVPCRAGLALAPTQTRLSGRLARGAWIDGERHGAASTLALRGEVSDMDDWWAEVEHDVLHCLDDQGTTSVEDIARRLTISEGAAVSLLAHLAREGKVRICSVEASDARSRAGGRPRAPAPAPGSGGPARRARPAAPLTCDRARRASCAGQARLQRDLPGIHLLELGLEARDALLGGKVVDEQDVEQQGEEQEARGHQHPRQPGARDVGHDRGF